MSFVASNFFGLPIVDLFGNALVANVVVFLPIHKHPCIGFPDLCQLLKLSQSKIRKVNGMRFGVFAVVVGY